MTQRCRVPAEDLITYSDGSLLGGRREIVEAHLVACPYCKARLAQYREVDRLIQEECSDSSFALGQRVALRRRLVEEATPGLRFTTHRPGRLFPGIAVAILLAILVYPGARSADFLWGRLGHFAEIGGTGSPPENPQAPLYNLNGPSNDTTSLESTPIAPTELPFGFSETEQSIIGSDRVDLSYWQGTDADGDGMYTSTEFQAAISALFGYYEWPARYTPDVETATSWYGEGELADALFQVPGEYTVVGMYFKCAWGQTWLDAFADGDTASMDESMRNLREELVINPLNAHSAQDHNKEIYDKASLGEPALLRQFVDVACGGMDWIALPGTPG